MVGSYLKELVGVRLEAVTEARRKVRVTLLGDLVDLDQACSEADVAAKRRVVVVLQGKGKAITAHILPHSAEVQAALNPPAERNLICAAVQTPFTEMPLTRQRATPLASAPFSLFLVDGQGFEAFQAGSTNGQTLKGYRVRSVDADAKTQYGVVDLLMDTVTADPKDILAGGLPFEQGQPGGAWSLPIEVFHDLPFKVDVYIYPGDHERVYFGEVNSGTDKVRPHGSLLIANAAKKVDEAVRGGGRVTLDECSVDHDSFLTGVVSSRIILDRGCDPSDPTKPGAWEVVNSPRLVTQLCFSLSMSKQLTRLDRGDVPAPGFINLTEKDDRPASKRQRTLSTSPPPSRGDDSSHPPSRRPRSPPPRRR